MLPALAAEGAMASYALSEREAGSDAASMRTRAKADGDHWILNGAKCWITNGGKSTWYTVMAVTDPDRGANGISAFMVHKDDEGFTVGPKERKLGIKGSPTTELYFENCRIPGDRIIGEPGTGFKTALATLDHTRPTIGAQAVGIAQGALDAAIAYTKDRKQFGESISTFQAVQFMLADMAMKVEAARLMVYLPPPAPNAVSRIWASFRRPRSASPPTSRWRSPPMPYNCSAAPATPPTSRSSGLCATPRSPRSMRAPIRFSG